MSHQILHTHYTALIDFSLLKILLIFAAILIPLSPDFKLTTLAFLILTLVLKMKLKSMFLAAFLASVFSFPLYVPNKSYTIPTIQYQNFKLGQKVNYLQTYGLSLTNIGLLMTTIALIKKRTVTTRPSKTILVTMFVLFVSVFLAVSNSILYSPFPELSIVWSLHYSQLYVVALYTAKLLTDYPKAVKYLTTVIISVIVLQSCLAGLQFMIQSPLGIPFENLQGTYFAMGLDENNALYRVAGTFAYHNELAIIMVNLLILVLGHLSKQTVKLGIPLWILGTLVVVLTQSRSSFIALLFISLIVGIKHKKIIIEYLKGIGVVRVSLYAATTLLMLSPVLIPRIILSLNVFEKGAGIPVRITMINEALSLVSEKMLFGYGTGTNEYILFENKPQGIISQFTASVHNGFLGLLLEIGALGLMLACLPFFMVFRSINAQSIQSPSGTIFVLGITTWFIYYLLQPHNGIIEFPYIGLVLGYGLFTTTKKNT